MGQNKKVNVQRVLLIFMSLSGYVVGSILIGMYFDQFFNNGISVIVMFLLGILFAFSHLIKLLIDLGDSDD